MPLMDNFSDRQNTHETVMADKLDQRKLPKALTQSMNRKRLRHRWALFQPGEELRKILSFELTGIKKYMEYKEVPCINCRAINKIIGSAPSRQCPQKYFIKRESGMGKEAAKRMQQLYTSTIGPWVYSGDIVGRRAAPPRNKMCSYITPQRRECLHQ